MYRVKSHSYPRCAPAEPSKNSIFSKVGERREVSDAVEDEDKVLLLRFFCLFADPAAQLFFTFFDVFPLLFQIARF